MTLVIYHPLSKFNGDVKSSADLYDYWKQIRSSYKIRFERAVKDHKKYFLGSLTSTKTLDDLEGINTLFHDVLTSWTEDVKEFYDSFLPASYLHAAIFIADGQLFNISDELEVYLRTWPTYDRRKFSEHLLSVRTIVEKEGKEIVEYCSRYLDQFSGPRIRI